MPNLQTVRRMLEAHGQGHLLNHYESLTASQQTALVAQIAAIHFEQLDEWIAQYVLKAPTVEIPADIAPPEIESGKPADEAGKARHARAIERGRQLLAEGRVAAFVVAGGQGTRLGYEGPKGCFEVTPVKHKPLFQVFAEQILAAGRAAGRPVPWYVMTSPANDVPTRAFFRQKGYFGLNEKDVYFLAQGTLPAIGLDGKVLLAGVGELALSPDGHGGSLRALRASGALADMARRGVELISYFQVDNPLVRCVDPLFLGLHDLAGAEMSAKALPKREPMEKLGNFCLVGGKVTVIEYSDLPEALARATRPDGRLRFSAGSIAIHILGRSFVERLTADGRCQLPLHRAEKKVPFLDAQGMLVKPETPNAVKLEMFVFDAMPLAKKAVILETDRAEEFSPVKNAQGADSPATCLHDQVRRAARWLAAAGVALPRDADKKVAAAIEISPLYADSPEALAKIVDPKLTITAGQNLYLGE
ncbi:MAG: UDPGP type 1 family protein [Planctomycetota bacterium]|nr:UDPGP type 1 family protein [Planctomycetota bacterium]